MSIRLRVIGAFLTLIVSVMGLELYDRHFIADISGDALTINLSGSQRQRTNKLAYLSHHYMRKNHRNDLVILADEIERYEEILKGLMYGSDDLGLKGTKNPEILSALAEAEVMWKEYRGQISLIVSNISVEEKLKALDAIDTLVFPLLEKMVMVTFALDRESTTAVESYSKIKLYSLILFIAVGLILTMNIIRALVRPMNRLLGAIERAATGDLDTELKIEGNDEFSRVAESFNQMERNLKGSRQELERVNKELEDFVYIVSHDLKEPLRGIAAFSHFLIEDYNDKLDAEGRDHLKRIIRSSGRMKELIDDLLALSRVGRIKNPFATVPSSEIVEEGMTGLHHQVKETGARVKVQEDLPAIFCDRVKMSEVFMNMLSNAVKFCDRENPAIEVGCDDLPEEHRFYVKDNGIGIDGRYYEKVFEIFERLNRKEEYEGTGAGLAIVKKVIEEHNGRVWVESELGEGSTFFFTIPKKT